MKYENERRVKLLTRKTPAFYRLGQAGRTVLWHLHMDADLLGRIEVEEGDESRDIAKRLDLDAETFRVGLDRCFAEDAVRWETSESTVVNRGDALRGIAACEVGALVIVDFVPIQEAKRSRNLRDAEYRERMRLVTRQAERLRKRHGVGKKSAAKSVAAADVASLGLLNRAAAAAQLGISIPTLRRRHEGQGLTIYRSELGEYLFQPDEVQALALKLVKDQAPKAPPNREPPAEHADSPIWRERAARLAEAMGAKTYTSTEVAGLAKKIGLKDHLVAHVLAAAEGLELVKMNGRWSANRGEK